MRVGLTRSFHAGRAALAFRRAKGGQDGASATPRKSSGEYRWFEDAAAYSKFQSLAPELTNEKLTLSVATPELLASAAPGQLLAWPGEVQTHLHHLGSYKPSQKNELFRSPLSVVRSETARVWNDLLAGGGGKSAVITGGAGAGKTSLLTQAHAAASLRGWGVLHISQAEKLLDGSTDAVYDETARVWNQPMFASRLWKKTVKANRRLLSDQAKASVKTLSEIASHFQGKLLVTVDNINALNHAVYAQNTNKDNERLYHNELEVVNTLLKWISGPRENMTVLAATSGNFKEIDWKGYAYAPLSDFDPQLIATLGKAERIDLPHFSQAEAEAFVNYLHAAEVTSKPWQELFQYGNGNPRTILEMATNFAY